MIVVFDIGNVLLRWDPRNLYRRCSTTRRGWSGSSRCVLAWTSSSAPTSSRTFPRWSRRGRGPSRNSPRDRLFDTRWVEILGGPIEENVALLRRLRAAGRPVHALSNFASAKFAVSEGLHHFLREFDTRVVSGHVGVAKPDPRIYRSCSSGWAAAARAPVHRRFARQRSRRRGGRHGDDPSSGRRPRSRAEGEGGGHLTAPFRAVAWPGVCALAVRRASRSRERTGAQRALAAGPPDARQGPCPPLCCP